MVSAPPDPVALQVVEKVDPPERPEDEASRLYRNLTFDIQRCAFHHGMRARFLDSFEKIGSLLSFISGAGAFTTILGHAGQSGSPSLATTALTASATFFAGLNMIIGFSRRARDHEVLRSKYYGLLVDMKKAKGDRTKLAELDCKMTEHFAGSVIFMTATDMIVYNRTCLAQDPDAPVFHIPVHHRLLAHFRSFTGYYSKQIPQVPAKTT
jgi:hypothetical protein